MGKYFQIIGWCVGYDIGVHGLSSPKESNIFSTIFKWVGKFLVVKYWQ